MDATHGARTVRVAAVVAAVVLLLSWGIIAHRGTGGTGGEAPRQASAREPQGAPVTVAFGGDVHFEGSSAAAAGGDLGTAGALLRKADLALVNLETAVTTGGDKQPKQFTFRAPPSVLRGLRTAGVDAVGMANNHGMDYGRTGLTDTLAAAADAGLPVLGAGKDLAAAQTPLRTQVHGVRIAVFAATDVLDDFATTTWPATATTPGLFSVKGAGESRLVAAVRDEKRRSDVVLVLLHWGVDQRVCPTDRQQALAAELAQAGAAAVVGSHAHVVQPSTRVGSAFVDYGLGNFVFYAQGGPAAQTGVLTLTVTRAGVKDARWDPGVIRSGRPQLLTGTDRAAAVEALQAGARSCGTAAAA